MADQFQRELALPPARLSSPFCRAVATTLTLSDPCHFPLELRLGVHHPINHQESFALLQPLRAEIPHQNDSHRSAPQPELTPSSRHSSHLMVAKSHWKMLHSQWMTPYSLLEDSYQEKFLRPPPQPDLIPLICHLHQSVRSARFQIFS